MSTPVALVTGGGSGIGLAVAEHLINQHGYKVAILDIDAKRVKTESDRLGASNCLGLRVDVTDYDQQAKAFQQTFEWGSNRLDLFFANAGIGDSDSMYMDSSGIDEHSGLPKPMNLKTIDIDLYAVIQGIHLARHFFAEKNGKPGGKIVATASVIGIYANHPMPLYSAAKHGVVGLTRALAPVYLKDKITINCLCPALVRTNLMPSEHADEAHIPEETTPMSTVLKAFDRVETDHMFTGQVMELTMDEVVLKQQPEYSRPNVKWCVDQPLMWEKVCAGVLPRKPGENAAQIQVPKETSF